MSSYKKYCIQFVNSDTMYQISFQADLKGHSISQILLWGIQVYQPRYEEAIYFYLTKNNLYNDHISTHLSYMTMVQEYLTEFQLPFSHLSYAQFPIDISSAWNLPGEMLYPADQQLEPYMQKLKNPDELYQLIQVKKYPHGRQEDSFDFHSRVSAVKAVKDLSEGYQVKCVDQTFYCEQDRPTTTYFYISTCHSRDEMPVELCRSTSMCLSPFADQNVLLLIHIDKLESPNQVLNLFGCND